MKWFYTRRFRAIRPTFGKQHYLLFWKRPFNFDIGNSSTLFLKNFMIHVLPFPFLVLFYCTLCPLTLSMNGGRQRQWQLPGWGSSYFLAALPLCLKAGIEFPAAPAGWIHWRSQGRGRVLSRWTNLSLFPMKPLLTMAPTPQDPSLFCLVQIPDGPNLRSAATSRGNVTEPCPAGKHKAETTSLKSQPNERIQQGSFIEEKSNNVIHNLYGALVFTTRPDSHFWQICSFSPLCSPPPTTWHVIRRHNLHIICIHLLYFIDCSSFVKIQGI